MKRSLPIHYWWYWQPLYLHKLPEKKCTMMTIHTGFRRSRGDVVYSSNACGFYVVENHYGYTIIQNLDGLRTYDGDIVYGDFGAYGTRTFYNYSADVLTRGNVVEYDLRTARPRPRLITIALR